MNYYKEIKRELISNEVYRKVKDYSKNKNDLQTYYKVGMLLVEAQGGETRAKYGDRLIKKYSEKLMIELDKKYSYRNLMYMRKFYITFKNQNMNTLCSQLSWSHYRLLLSLEDNKVVNYYINQAIVQNLSVRELRNKIKNKEYERLDLNTKEKIINNKPRDVSDYIKNPIILNNKHNYSMISEKILKQLILEDLDNFLKELGQGFSYLANEYKIKLGERNNYIDLLLYNILYNCYVIVELKVTELKKEHIGQIEIYMNYIDKNLKTIEENKTIGIIICKKDNKFVMEYCSDERIFATSYEII